MNYGTYHPVDSENETRNPGSGTFTPDSKYSDYCFDTVPYSMIVNVDFNGGDFYNSVYGGGNMGLVGDRDMVPNAMKDTPYQNYGDNTYLRADHQGRITVNVHGGMFHRHIFTGACGRPGMLGTFFGARDFSCTPQLGGESNSHYSDRQFEVGKNIDGGKLGKQLVYGIKILNMDGGKVRFSVYGGSESVDDGYPNPTSTPASRTGSRPPSPRMATTTAMCQATATALCVPHQS